MKPIGRSEDIENLEKLPRMEGDSDDVYCLGAASESADDHRAIDGQGWVEVVCPVAKRRYLHIIKCPNKFALACRGCGATV